jgi:hypothetical protein
LPNINQKIIGEVDEDDSSSDAADSSDEYDTE